MYAPNKMIQETFASIHSCLHMCLLVGLEMAIKKKKKQAVNQHYVAWLNYNLQI